MGSAGSGSPYFCTALRFPKFWARLKRFIIRFVNNTIFIVNYIYGKNAKYELLIHDQAVTKKLSKVH